VSSRVDRFDDQTPAARERRACSVCAGQRTLGRRRAVPAPRGSLPPWRCV
jgi:hypothetical protein